MTRAQIQKWLEEQDVAVLLADGLDGAFLGLDTSGDEPRAVYSSDKCIRILARDMGYEAAAEYFDYNVTGSYVGPQTPLFITTPRSRVDSKDAVEALEVAENFLTSLDQSTGGKLVQVQATLKVVRAALKLENKP